MSARPAVALALIAIAGCGGSPTAPPPPPAEHTVSVIVFYDIDGDSVQEPSEAARVPDVEVIVAGKTGRTEPGTGRALIAGVPEGDHPAVVAPGSLPAYYEPHPAATVTVHSPPTADVFLPVVLPIGANRPYVYMAFGDSITNGDGSTDGTGYRTPLEARLDPHFGAATVVNEGIPGTRSAAGAARIGSSLNRQRPAYSLITYGTNDWNERVCQVSFPCFTPDSVRSMIRSAKTAQSLPVMGTIPPVNVGYDARVPPARQDWVHRMNELLREIAFEEDVPVADLEEAFLAEPALPPLFFDHVHPNDDGYDIIAREFFEAVTTPLPSAMGHALFVPPAPPLPSAP
jgi:lysophospholipase L1-like esterase